MKKAFSLVELIVVIGIIGVLAGVLFTSFAGGTTAARAAKCLSNMRNLSQAAIGVATRGRSVGGDSSQFYPLAGSRAELGNDADVVYYEDVGWISWLSMNNEYRANGAGGKGQQGASGFVAVRNASAYSDGETKESTFAITNGALWAAVNGNREIYVCPEHQLVCAKKHVTVNWSYVMSAYFGYDWSDGSKAVALSGSGADRVSLNSTRLDRTLLFAELPFNDHDFSGKKIDTVFSTAPNTQNDCVLQYKAGTIDGESFGKDWSGPSETIAFNHKSGKRWCAHVAFADGHTEKLLLPKGGGGLTKEQLTALLCGDDNRNGGKDVSFTANGYQKLKN